MSYETQIRILLGAVSDESRVSVRKTLSLVPDFALSAETADAAKLVQELQSSPIDVVILCLPEVDAVGLTKQIRTSNPSVRVLIFTASDSTADIFAAMDAGADAYVLKSNLPSVLEIAVRSVRAGAVWLDPGIAKQVLQVAEAPPAEPSRILPTGFFKMPLLPDEKSVLTEVAFGNCKDGVCTVDPSFIRQLKRFSTSHAV